MKHIQQFRIGLVIGAGFAVVLMLALVIALLGRVAYDISRWQSNTIQTRSDVERLSLQLEILSIERTDFLRRYLENNDVTILATYQTTQSAYSDIFLRLETLLHSPEERQTLNEVIEAETAFSNKVEEILDLYNDGFPAAARFLWESEGIISQRNLLRTIENLRAVQGRISGAVIEDAQRTQNLTIIAISIFIPILLIVGAITSWFITRSIARPISNLVDTVNRLRIDLTAQGQPSGPKEIAFLGQTINQMGEGLYTSQLSLQAYNQRLEQEMALASQIQASFLPAELPKPPGLELAVFWKSAREVGGDFYAFVDLQNERYGLAVGDVSGKGTPAAMVGALSVGLLEAYAVNHPTRPENLLGELNEDLCSRLSQRMMNVACCYAIIDTPSQCLTVANAGCMFPYLWRAGSVHEITARGLPLGAWSNSDYVAQTIQLHSGDLLIFSTDGLVEAQNEQKHMLGFERLQQEILAFPKKIGAQIAVNMLVDAAMAFTSTEELHDDITIVVARIAN